jgi:glycosyltransferase involved in cell wall biosynthesis
MSSPVSDRADLPRFLTALPVFNECRHVTSVLDEVVKYAADVLVVDDGSTDCTHELLSQRDDVEVILHPENRGYGAALQTAFDYAIVRRYDVVVTIDCDGQHEPQRITHLVDKCRHTDIVSGSRYLHRDESAEHVPADRRRINEIITLELNKRLGLKLTDAFCGFKAYRTSSLAVPLIYLDEERSFGGALDAADTRLEYYRQVINRAVKASCPGPPLESSPKLCGFGAQPCH